MDDYRTPPEIYDSLHLEFDFNDDPCPIGGTGGLDRAWGTRTFMNPPYSNPHPWCEKAVQESQRGKIVVGILRVDTSTRWFHDFVLHRAEIRWIKGRIKFNGGRAPFASMVVIWDGTLDRSR